MENTLQLPGDLVDSYIEFNENLTHYANDYGVSPEALAHVLQAVVHEKALSQWMAARDLAQLFELFGVGVEDGTG